MAQAIKTRRRGQGISAFAFMNRGFSSGANEVYKDSGERALGKCEAHKGLHVKRDGCEGFQIASVNEIAEDTFARF